MYINFLGFRLAIIYRAIEQIRVDSIGSHKTDGITDVLGSAVQVEISTCGQIVATASMKLSLTGLFIPSPTGDQVSVSSIYALTKKNVNLVYQTTSFYAKTDAFNLMYNCAKKLMIFSTNLKLLEATKNQPY